MMYAAISLTGYILDMLTLYAYLNGILKVRGRRYIFFYPALLLVELLLYVNDTIIANHNSNSTSLIITTILSMTGTFCLTLFFDCRIMDKIFAAICYQVFAAFSEILFTIIIRAIDPAVLDTADSLKLLNEMSSGSKILLFILVLLSDIFWRRKEKNPVEYNLLLLTTPVITLVIFLVLPSQEEDVIVYTTVTLGLLVLNIINFILINRIYSAITSMNRVTALEKQVNFQTDKYAQLSESYKQSRRIIHDIKKHYFVINEYAKDAGARKISDYMDNAIRDIESTYIRYNTGNLVIDSMLTNYENIARQSGVDFSADLHIDNKRVPVRDYDLSIILGNILDNAIKATSDDKGMYICVEIVTGEDNRFQIICENSVSRNAPAHETQPHKEIEHGYGLSNIRTTVEKYYGFMPCIKDNPWIISIEIPITSDEQFIAPPHWRRKSTNSHN